MPTSIKAILFNQTSKYLRMVLIRDMMHETAISSTMSTLTLVPATRFRRSSQPVSARLESAIEVEGPADSLPQCLESTSVLRGGRSIQITHNGSVYRLQATRLGKLILTK